MRISKKGDNAGKAGQVPKSVLLPIFAVMVAGGWLTGYLFLSAQESERAKYRERILSIARIHTKQLEGELRGCLVTTRELQQYLARQGRIQAADFSRFTRPLISDRPEIRALEWIPLVTDSSRGAFEQLARRELGQDYVIREHGDAGELNPASRRDSYYPVFYIEPFAGNEKASGYDLRSDPIRRAALESARDMGAPQVTGRIRLVQEEGVDYGFFLCAPVYKGVLPVGSVEARRAALEGFALGVFRASDILHAALAPEPYPDLSMAFVDLSASAGERNFHVWEAGESAADFVVPLLYPKPEPLVLSFRFAGRLFGLQVVPCGKYIRTHYSLAYVMLLPAGITVSLLLGYALYRLALRRRQLMEALHQRDVLLGESLERQQLLTEKLPVGAIQWDLAFKVQSWNEAAAKMFGYTREEAIGKHAGFIVPESSRNEVERVWQALVMGQGGFRSTNKNVTKAGMVITCEWYNIPVRRVDGEIGGVVSFVEDVTERQRSEVIQQRYQLVLQYANDAILLVSLDGRLVEVNDAAVGLYGYSRTELLERRIWDLRSRSAPGLVKSQMERARESGIIFEAEHQRKDGSLIPVEVSSRGVRIGGEEFLLSICRDLSARRKAEGELKESVQRFAQVSEVVGELIWEINPEGRYTYVNNFCQPLLGYSPEELVGMEYSALFADEQQGQHQFPDLIRRRGKISAFPRRLKKKDGRDVKVLTTAIPVQDNKGVFTGYRGCDLDLTAQDSLERQLRQAQKMEAVATLAGGIAHDFNNMLFAIMGFTSIALRQAGENKQLRNDLEQVMTASRRSSDLVKQLLIFSRQAEKRNMEVVVSPIVKETSRLLRGAIPEIIDVRTELLAENDHILADPVQIQQVIMNLGSNAFHAMREKGGVLTLKLENAAPHAGPEDLAGDSGWLCLSVTDTGCGIEPEHLDRLFEPFFTTKTIGEGTGLGLAVVHGIVTAANGSIEVDSRVGEGTTFRIYLPLMGASAGVSPLPPDPVPVPGKGRHVLCVDDETVLSQMMHRTLELMGYQITAFNDGIAAIEALRKNPWVYDVLLTDYAMPGMTGVEVCVAARAIQPKLPMVILTGFTDDKNMELRCAEVGATLKFKPLSSGDLGNAIQEALASQR